MNTIFNGNYNATAISIYWVIWYLCLKTLKGTIYIKQEDLCNMIGIKSLKTFRDNIKPLIKDKLIIRKMHPKSNGGYGVYSYNIN